MLWETLPAYDVAGKVVVDARRGVGDVEPLCSGCQQRVHLVLVALASLSGVVGGGGDFYSTGVYFTPSSQNSLKSSHTSPTSPLIQFWPGLRFIHPTIYFPLICFL